MDMTISARLKKKLEGVKDASKTDLPKSNSAASSEVPMSKSASKTDLPKSNSAASIGAKMALKEAIRMAKGKSRGDGDTQAVEHKYIDEDSDAVEVHEGKRYYWNMKKRGTEYRPWKK